VVKRIPEIRTSERTTWRQCPQKWWWGYRQGLVPKGALAKHFWFGSLIHEVLAARYQEGRKRLSDAKCLALWDKLCANEYETMRTNEWDDREYIDAQALGREMLTNYFAEYGADDHMDIIATEQVRKVPVYDYDGNLICYYLYTMDGIYRDLDDHNLLKLLEHKTALMVNLGHLPLDDQAGSYLAFETLLQRDLGTIGPDEAIVEITYNILRKAVKREDDRPTDAQGRYLNKDGTVSKRQNDQAPLFVRHPVARSEAAREQIIDRIVTEAIQMREMRADPSRVYKNPSAGPFGCTSCPFFQMCQLHEEGGDWEDLRDWTFRQQDPYGPYRKVA